ncbi:hypothetical protein A1Q2_07314 [Trichosporon asahii var. asahii CBS 8904]|uniref:UBC core domain-containing protein n=1 Tax=Trichosporon asahii var. asahii (strain CBS 8904) TaxID=1220162 RepID=K1VBW5_TRIAC|nr:hypothetical protein A1Q2_07314 [Trichosporon asahii var. asahii CBS 8904]
MAVRRGGADANTIADLARENLGAITLAPNESNIFQWKAVIPGPAGSPYEGGEFEVEIRVPDDYPYATPQETVKEKPPPPPKVARPRPVHRDTNGSPAPAPPLAGSRRRANGAVEGGSSTPINLTGSDDEDDIQVVEGSRRPKRSRVESSTPAAPAVAASATAPNDEVIVIDD